MTHKIKRLIYVALFTLFHCHKTHVRLAKRTIMFHSQDLNSDCHRVKTEADSDMAFIFKARAAMRGPWLFVDLLRWSLIKLKLFDPIHDQTPLIVFAYKKVYVWRDKFLNHPWCGMRLIGKTMVAITRLKRKLLSGRENFNAL